MKYKLIVLIIFISIQSSFCQVRINFGVDTLDVNIVSAIKFYRQYIGEFNKGAKADYSKYYSAEDCKQFKVPDKMAFSLMGDDPIYKWGKPTIISIKQENKNVHIKTLFADTDSLKELTVYYICNNYVGFDRAMKPYFINPMSINVKQWQSATNRNVTYYFPKYHRFNKVKSDSLIRKITQLEKDWDLKPINIRYYFTDTNDEMQIFKGFDYNFEMGSTDKPSGLSDATDNLVFSSGWGENYFHEIVHLYLNKLHPNSPLNEGLAVFYGGSLGHNLDWHLHRINQYLKEHPEIDLNFLDKFYYMDNLTNPNSALKGLLCELTFKKKGVIGLKKLMSYNSLDEILSEEFNVKKLDWNKFFRTMLQSY